MVKSSCCFRRGPEFVSQHLYGESHTGALRISAPGDLLSSSGYHGHLGSHVAYTHMPQMRLKINPNKIRMKSLSFCVAIGMTLPWSLNTWWQLGLSFMETWRLQAQMTELGR